MNRSKDNIHQHKWSFLRDFWEMNRDPDNDVLQDGYLWYICECGAYKKVPMFEVKSKEKEKQL